ncbi:MAG: hypothetical protein IIC49_02500 [Planctomycetes bacterium]|nr:hypothetical protein [Planctomycetota bacterium]
MIDEAGVVHKVRARTRDLEAFLSEPPVEFEEAAAPQAPNLDKLRAHVSSEDSSDLRDPANLNALRYFIDSVFLWGGPQRLDEAILIYQSTLAMHDDATFAFHLGVALQSRYEKSHEPDDFARAIKAWSHALASDPNQYIWRRRIQQYGPRLDKPYSFYDWVSQARDEISARGETPWPLATEPRGAELAYPARTFVVDETAKADPDPDARINLDQRGLIGIETIVVPTTEAGGSSSRVHVLLTPNESLNAHWNNESDETEVWLSPPPGWRVNALGRTAPNGPGAVSTEPRRVEFEILPPEDASPGIYVLSGYALYYVCEDADGQCLYLRRDIQIPITVR